MFAFTASSRVEQRLGLIDGFAKVPIPDGRVDHEVNGPAEHRLESLADVKIGVRIVPFWNGLKLDEKIEVAVRGVVLAARRGPEHFQAYNAVPATKFGKSGGVLGECWTHGRHHPHTIAQNQARGLVAPGRPSCTGIA
jgi:hypothetical protein